MQAIEFTSKAHDGVVDLPKNAQNWNGKQVRVIMLEAENQADRRKFDFEAIRISTRAFRFDREEANAR